MIILEKGDIIAIQLTEHLTQVRLENFGKKLNSLLNVEILLIPVGMSLEVYRKNYE